MDRRHILVTVLFLGAALVRYADVFRPINHPSWREADLGAVSRNFATESMDPLKPAIDWRGDGPGYAEMEFPLYPWLTAVTYKTLGMHDQAGRIWAFVFSLATLLLFFQLAREYLTIFPATIAFAFFALNPLLVEKSTAIQPEGLMMLAYVAAVLFFVRWIRNERSLDFWLACFATALTLLAKAPAAHIGLFFGILLLQKYGLRVVSQVRVWIFGIIAVAPPALWYLHAKNLWLAYGNSLGVSNEYHWIGWDFFTDPNFAKGILSIEFFSVWVTFGLVVGLFAVWKGYREEVTRHSLLWLAAIFAMYLLAARTTSQSWANYYHVFAIAPVSLLFGTSIKKVWDYARDFADRFSQYSAFALARKIAVILVVVFSILASLALEGRQIRANFADRRIDDPGYLFAQQVRFKLTKPGLIVVSGGRCRDDKGYELAYNASYMFYWLERKGWNICVEDHRPDIVERYRDKGAVYLIEERAFSKEQADFDPTMRAHFPVVAESAEYVVFEMAR